MQIVMELPWSPPLIWGFCRDSWFGVYIEVLLFWEATPSPFPPSPELSRTNNWEKGFRVWDCHGLIPQILAQVSSPLVESSIGNILTGQNDGYTFAQQRAISNCPKVARANDHEQASPE